MKIIFVNRFFHPDHSATSQMLSDLAFELARAERRIAVVTSRQLYDDPGSVLVPREMIEGVDVYRIWTTRFGRFHLIGRAVDYITFYLSAAIAVWRLAGAGDVVVAKTDPPMLSVALGPVVWRRRAKLVNWLQDIFPEVGQSLGIGRGRLAGWIYCRLADLRNRSLRFSSANVVLGERMAEHVVHLGIPRENVHIIANWADGAAIQPVARSENPLRRNWGLSDNFVVGYSGNLGRAHDYQTLIEAIALFERGPASPVRWLFIGGGALFESFKSEVARRGLATVQFRPYQPRDALARSLSVPDIHLVTLRPELEGLIVPSKIYGIAAAGRAAIFIGDSDGEIARLLARTDSGVTVSPGDSARLAFEIQRLAADLDRLRIMGANARAALLGEYDRPIAARRWGALFDTL